MVQCLQPDDSPLTFRSLSHHPAAVFSLHQKFSLFMRAKQQQMPRRFSIFLGAGYKPVFSLLLLSLMRRCSWCWPRNARQHAVNLSARARMHHKVVGNFGSEADVRSLYYRRFRFNETSDVGACTHGRPAKQILTRPRYFENEPDFRTTHTKLERLLSKSLTTLEVMTHYLVVHTGPGRLRQLHLLPC